MLPTSLRRATWGVHVRKVNGKVNIDQEIEATMRANPGSIGRWRTSFTENFPTALNVYDANLN